MTKALFLDFDGVLFDSLPEAYRLGRFAYRGTDVHAPVDEVDYACFSALRFLITNSAQYWRVFRLIDLCGGAAKDADYRAGYAELTTKGFESEMRQFDERFLSLRKKLIAEEHEFWLSLSTPYPFFKALIPRFNSAFPPVIVTTKNRDAVLENLTQAGVFGIPEKILDKADYARRGSKSGLISDYMKMHGIESGIFVDDVLENVRECSVVSNLECLHAGWGYCDPQMPGETFEEILKHIEQ